jgi:Flp pilus assembly protein protease CpaA
VAVVLAVAAGVGFAVLGAPDAGLSERILRAACVAGLIYIGLVDLWARLIPTWPTLALGLAGLSVNLHSADAALSTLAWPLGLWCALRAVAVLGRRLRGRDVLGAGDADLTAALACWFGGGTPVLFGIAVGAALLVAAVRKSDLDSAPLGFWLAVLSISGLARPPGI